MFILPEIKKHSVRRPDRARFEDPVLIARDNDPFWEDVYTFLRERKPQFPLERSSQEIIRAIDPEHGFYGFRTHPITGEENYFHLGIEISSKGREEIYPLYHSVLEYSGYGVREGYYVLLSHPQIQTEDGYVLHSLYCHMKKPAVKFSAREKMLREISLGTYPIVKIGREKVIGFTGSSGKTVGNDPVLYLQVDFRKFEEKTIVIDPLKLFKKRKYRNKNAS